MSGGRVTFPGGKHAPLNVNPEQIDMLLRKEAVRKGSIFYVSVLDREALLELIASEPSVMRCDFCSTIPCVVTFMTPDFLMIPGPSEGNLSTGGFSACVECTELVRKRDQDAVYRRAIRLLRVLPDIAAMYEHGDGEMFENAVRFTHRQFFSLWEGEEVALDG